MKNVKPIILLSSILFVMVLLIPALVVMPFADDHEGGKLTEELQTKEMEPIDVGPTVSVPVYRSQAAVIEEIPLEEYVVGVVASEMPADFELEALKAQALTARTYIIKHLLLDNPIGVPEGAVVTDTTHHQVYKSTSELKEQWGDDYPWNLEKIREAVLATAGKVLTYNNEPIDAQFFSTSNGFTENSEEYWPNEYPYLRSVESPWDKDSKEFLDQTIMPVANFEAKLGVKLSNDGSIGKIVARTTGNRVKTVDINGKQLTGREVRELLKLRSSDFVWERRGDQVVIQTKGYGHGVGMSQYGANGMAQEGHNYEQIITHYYKDVQIASAEQFVTKLTAQQ